MGMLYYGCGECHVVFSVKGVTYKFKALPFGLSTTPWMFTKCLASVAAHLCLQGVTVFPCLDKWLLVVPSHTQAKWDTVLTLSLLSALRLQVNSEKSTLQPTQRVAYKGAILDASVGCASLSLDRIAKIQLMLHTFHQGALVLALQPAVSPLLDINIPLFMTWPLLL